MVVVRRFYKTLPQVLDTHDGMGVDDIESLVSVSSAAFNYSSTYQYQ